MGWSVDASEWPGELVALAASFALAALTRALRTYQRQRSETWPISYGQILSVSAEEKDKRILLKALYSYRANN